MLCIKKHWNPFQKLLKKNNKLQLIKKKIMNIFFFGGAFNPPHIGHYKIVLNCLKYADKFIIIPNKMSPHNNKQLIDAQHRINMLQLMFKENNINIDTFEIESKKDNYSIYTVEYLLKKYSNCKLTMVVGLDQYLSIKTWYKYEELIKKVEIRCFNRVNNNFKTVIDKKINFIKDFKYNLSSTTIKNFIIKSDFKQLKESVHKNVSKYIIDNNLYAI